MHSVVMKTGVLPMYDEDGNEIYAILTPYQQKIEKIPLNTLSLSVLVVVGVVLEALECNMFGDCQFYIGSYLIVFAMMIFAIKHPSAEWKLLTHLGRDLSMYIYIFHIAVGKVVDISAKNAHWWGKNPYYIGRPFLVMALSLLLAEVIWQSKKYITSIKMKKCVNADS